MPWPRSGQPGGRGGLRRPRRAPLPVDREPRAPCSTPCTACDPARFGPAGPTWAPPWTRPSRPSTPRSTPRGEPIVVFSDGEDHADRWSSRLERLRQQDIVVHAVAIGDAEQGHPVPSGKTAQPLMYHGEPVLSRRSDAALEAIARQTGGMIVRLGLASGDLGDALRNQNRAAARRRREASRLADRAERFPLLLFAALVLLLAGCWPPGRGWSWTWHWTWSWRRSAEEAGSAGPCCWPRPASDSRRRRCPTEDPGGVGG